MHSVSEPDWKIEPRSISSSRKLSALVRLPLCAIGAAAHGELGEQRLHVAQLGRALRAGGRIAHVPDRERPGQRLHQRRRGEVVAHVAEAPRQANPTSGA